MAISITNVIPATVLFGVDSRITIIGTDLDRVTGVTAQIIGRDNTLISATNLLVVDQNTLRCYISPLSNGDHRISITDGTDTVYLDHAVVVIDTRPQFPFEDETFDNIQSRVLARLPDGSDIREGSTYWDFYAPINIEIEKIYLSMREGIELGFLTHTTKDYLPIKGVEYGVQEIEANKAKVTIKFTVNAPVVIPAGTIVQNDISGGHDLLQFETTDGLIFTLPPGQEESAEVLCEAIEVGTRYNIVANTLTQLAINIPQVTNVQQEEASYGGRDDEETEHFRSRIIRRARTPSRGGNIGDYEIWAQQAHEAVEKVGVFPLKRGNGTVDVTVLGIEDLPLADDIIEDIQNYIMPLEERALGTRLAPVGADALIRNADRLLTEIRARINLAFGVLPSDIEDIIEETIDDYFESLQIGERVDILALISLIERITGVERVNSINLHRPDGKNIYNQNNNLVLLSANGRPTGIGSDGTHILTLQLNSRQVYAISIVRGEQDSSKQFTTIAANANPVGMDITANRIWIGDNVSNKFYSYNGEGVAQASEHWDYDSSSRNVTDFIWHNSKLYVIDDQNPAYVTVLSASGIQDRDAWADNGRLPDKITNARAIFGNADYVWIADDIDEIAYRFQWDGTESPAGDIPFGRMNDVKGAWYNDDNGAIYLLDDQQNLIHIYTPDSNIEVQRDEKLIPGNIYLTYPS